MGAAKQDKAPGGHAAASPRCHKENTWRYHHRQVLLAVAGSMDHVILWQSPKNGGGGGGGGMRTKIYGCQHFEMSIVMQRTYFGSHHVVI